MSEQPQTPAYLESSVTVREAVVGDASFLAYCRARMFEEMGVAGEATEDASRAFVAYVERELPAGTFFAYVAETEGVLTGSAAAFVHETVPMALNPSGRVGRIVNVFVEPAWRRRGAATVLVEAVVERLRADGVGVAALAATPEGAAVYERLGFEHYDEMRAIL